MSNGDFRSLWIALFCVNLVNSTQAAIAVVGIPSHVVSEQFSAHQLASLLGIFPIAAGLSALFSGTVSDLMGRRPTLIAGLLILSASLLLHAASKDFQTLLILRAVSGFATGVLTGLPSTLLSDSVPKHRQIQATGRALSGYALGQTIGIPIGIALLEYMSFPDLCSAMGGIALALTFVIRYRLPSHNPSKYLRNNDLKNYCRAAFETIKDSGFGIIALCSFLSFTALSLFYSSFALWLVETLQLRPTEIATMHLAGGILQVLVFLFVIQAIQRLQPHLAVSISLIANALVFLLIAVIPVSQQLPTLMLALTLGCVALRIPAFQFLVNNIGNEAQKGLRMSIVQTSNHVGKACGFIAASYLFEQLGLHQIVLLCGILTLLCGLLLLIPQSAKLFSLSNTPHTPYSPKLNVKQSRS